MKSSHSSSTMAKQSANVLPNWWAFTFIGLQLVGLLPLTYQHLSSPLSMFKNVLPEGFDLLTDRVEQTGSLRVEIVELTNVHVYPMILLLFIGSTLFARNSLKGQPILQQRLMKLIVWTGLYSDIWLYSIQIFKLPRSIILNPSSWPANTSGILYGLPIATALKLVWLFGLGRDVV